MVTWSQPLWASEESSEPWPVSKYMTLGPVQVPRLSMVARPSSSICRGQAEGLVALLAARDGLEHQVERRAQLIGRGDLGGHVGQHADLGGDLPLLLELVEHLQDAGDTISTRIVHRIQAQHRVAAAVGEALHQRRP